MTWIISYLLHAVAAPDARSCCTALSTAPHSTRQYTTVTQHITFYKKLKNVSCEYSRLNGWNSTLQAAWYIRRVRIIWFLWTEPTIRLLILSFTQNIVRVCSMFYPYEGYRSVTPLDAARVNRTIFHNHSVHWYYITLIRVGIILSTILLWDMANRTRVEGGGYNQHDIITWYD